jgi:hypothetical protein
VSRTISKETSRIEIGSLDGRHSSVVAADALVGYASGRLFFVRNGTLWAQAFDVNASTVSGEPASVVDDIFYSEGWTMSGASVRGGSLAYAPYRAIRRVASFGLR